MPSPTLSGGEGMQRRNRKNTISLKEDNAAISP